MNSDKRIWNALKLAAPLLDLGLTSEDSDSIQGLLNLHAKSLMTEFIKINGWRDLQVIDLILLIIEKYGVQLADLAQMRIWHKRRNKYYIEKKAWLAAEVDDRWRNRPMSSGQRYLVQSTAAHLQIEIPHGMKRGDASDWLESHMAHLILTNEIFNEKWSYWND